MDLNNKVERRLSGWVDSGANKIKLVKKDHIATITRQNDQYHWEVKHSQNGVQSYGKCATEELARARAEGKIH